MTPGRPGPITRARSAAGAVPPGRGAGRPRDLARGGEHNGISTLGHAGLVLGRRAERIAQGARNASGRNDGLPVDKPLLPIFSAKAVSLAIAIALAPSIIWLNRRLPLLQVRAHHREMMAAAGGVDNRPRLSLAALEAHMVTLLHRCRRMP